MKRKLFRPLLAVSSLLLLLLACFAAVSAHAQGRPNMKVDIPYTFSVGSKSMPPGSYSFSFLESANMLLIQQPKASPITAFVMARIVQPDDFLREGAVVFDNNDGHRTLSELWMRGHDGLLLHSLAPGHIHDVVIADYLNPSVTASGKDAFALTCARCHGADGKGNPNADAFFKIAIPRLTSPLVQRMTDKQLRTQINNGSKIMPPVEVDEGGFRHRLPPQDVDAVIAYVRSLSR